MNGLGAPDRPLSVVTVLYEAETELAELQGRSLGLRHHELDGMIHRIFLVDNTVRGLSERKQSRLRRSYGTLADKVQILSSSRIVPDIRMLNGWEGQQVLKLRVSEWISTRHYLVLDAKNHVVAPIEPSFLFTPDGRPRVPAYSYVSHPHRRRLESTLKLFGLDPHDYVNHFTATVTPFTFETDLVREMLSDVRTIRNESLTETFLRADLTEFFMYSSWLLATGRSLDTVMELVHQRSQTVWGGGTAPEAVQQTLQRNDAESSPFFSIHRAAYRRLNEPARMLISDYWMKHGLFATVKQAEAEIRRIRRGISRGQLQAALAERWPVPSRSHP